MIPSNKAYKHIASYYDKSTTLKVLKAYKYILGEIKNKQILDLGCGTGNILKHYSTNNETYGIDGSPEMIKIAKSKDKKSIYKIGDIVKFKYNKKFDIIVCTYDTINHLPSLKNWEQLFKNVSKHLSNEGMFIFDYNTIDSLKN
jgi:predicted TPR repeat methyltransferase